jgi:hypothetical protein
MRIGLAFVLVAGCGYHPGSFSGTSPYAGTRSTVGCLDLAIARRADLPDAAVLDYQFGNRCDKAVPVDLARVIVLARTSEGAEVRLSPYDPERELETLRLDARREGREAIAYPLTTGAVQICVDAASLVQAEAPQWICLGAAS